MELIVVLVLLSLFLSALAYEAILGGLHHPAPPVRATVGAWAKSLLGRYVPGNLLMVVGRAVMAQAHGVPRLVTLAATTYEQVIALAAAAALAARNAAALGLTGRAGFLAGDWDTALGPTGFDLTLSNPPYIPRTDKATLQHEVRDHEPELALYGGDDGLEIYRRLIPAAAHVLKPGGWLMLEMGWNQGDALSVMLASWNEVRIQADLAGLPRIAIARKP